MNELQEVRENVTDGSDTLVTGVTMFVPNQGLLHRHQDTDLNVNERRRRRKWTKEENKEAWKCYSLSQPTVRGFRKRMYDIWNERNNQAITEQRLSDQIRNIKKKNNWLSHIEKEEIERQVRESDNDNSLEEHNEQEDMRNEVPQMSTDAQDPVVADDMNEIRVNIEELEEKRERLRSYMMDERERIRLPTLKSHNQHKVKEKVKEVNEIIKDIQTNNITEINSLIYAGAKLTIEMLNIKISPIKPSKTKSRNSQPPWERRLNTQIEEMRRDLSRLKELADNRMKKKKRIEELYDKYKIQEKGLNHVIEDIKQRIKSKTYKVQRYINRNEGYKQNKLFETNQKRLYNQLRGENRDQDIPEAAPTRRLWESIWSKPVNHNKHAAWLEEIKVEEGGRIKQVFPEITATTVKNQLKKTPNWKAPGPDEVHGYWLKNFKSLHERIAQQIQQCINMNQAPEWMTTGKTALMQKDKSKGNIPSNYRPITCLPMMWKLLTGIISDRLYEYLEETNSIPFQQKGCRRKCRGTKDQLLIDKMIMKNSKKRKTNISMAWIDYRKAFDMVPHSWLIECLRIYGAEDNTINFLKNTMANWNTILTCSGKRLAQVKIKRGIFQGDSLSPLLFIIAMMPMTRALEKLESGYQLKKGGQRINHLMYMDDIKLFGKNKEQIDTLIQTVRIITEDIKMEFGIDKCGLIVMQRGKVIKTEGIQLPDGSTIKDIEEEGYKYLGVIQADTIDHQSMKDKAKKEYIQRLKSIMKSKLNAGNIVKAINTWAVPVIRYTAGIIDWRKDELKIIDRKTRKIMTLFRALHPRANTDRLYIPRKEGGKGLMNIEDCVNIEIRALGQYVKNNQDEWLRSVWDEGLLKEDEDPEKFKETMKKKRAEEWYKKPLHGQFITQTKDVSTTDTWQWLVRGELKKETEGMIQAAQDQALRTRYIQRAIDKQDVSPKCRKCNIKEETINHVISECSALAQYQYKKRHDTVAKALHWSLCQKYEISRSEKWYEHQPEAVAENEHIKLMWDFDIRTDRVIRAHRPDITMINKINGKVFLIDVAIPWDTRVNEKEREKVDKYHDLKLELERLWEMPVEIVPIILGALGTIPSSLKKNLKKIDAKVAPGLLQKSVLLETSHIMRRVLNS